MQEVEFEGDTRDQRFSYEKQLEYLSKDELRDIMKLSVDDMPRREVVRSKNFLFWVMFQIVIIIYTLNQLNEFFLDFDEKHKNNAKEFGNQYRNLLEKQLKITITATHSLATMVSTDYSGYEFLNAHFGKIVDSTLKEFTGINNIQMAPDAVVSKIHPLEGHEGAMGH